MLVPRKRFWVESNSKLDSLARFRKLYSTPPPSELMFPDRGRHIELKGDANGSAECGRRGQISAGRHRTVP